MRTAPALVAMVLAACSSQVPPPLDTEGAGGLLPAAGSADASAPATDADAASDAQPTSARTTSTLDAQQCALFVPSGIDVSETRVAESPPPATGGPVRPGYFELVAERVYTGEGGESGPTGRSVAETMYLDGVDFQDVRAVGQGVAASWAEPVYASGTYRADAAALTMATTCPESSTASVPYSSDGRRLLLYVGAGDGTVERELDLR